MKWRIISKINYLSHFPFEGHIAQAYSFFLFDTVRISNVHLSENDRKRKLRKSTLCIHATDVAEAKERKMVKVDECGMEGWQNRSGQTDARDEVAKVGWPRGAGAHLSFWRPSWPAKCHLRSTLTHDTLPRSCPRQPECMLARSLALEHAHARSI